MRERVCERGRRKIQEQRVFVNGLRASGSNASCAAANTAGGRTLSYAATFAVAVAGAGAGAGAVAAVLLPSVGCGIKQQTPTCQRKIDVASTFEKDGGGGGGTDGERMRADRISGRQSIQAKPRRAHIQLLLLFDQIQNSPFFTLCFFFVAVVVVVLEGADQSCGANRYLRGAW